MSNHASLLIIAGGFYNLLWSLFHLYFWKLFNWPDDLTSIQPINKAIIQMLNVGIIIFLLLIAFLSIACSQELLLSFPGKIILAGTAIFWGARLIGEFTLKDGLATNHKLVTFFLVGILLYTLPFLM